MNTHTPALTRLIEYIALHDGCAVIGVVGNSLIVESNAVIDGNVMREQSTIQATLQAVRDWLGY